MDKNQVKNIIHKVKSNLNTTHLLTPSNLDTERNAFLQNPTQNPNFIYPELPIDLLKKNLSGIQDAIKFFGLDNEIIESKIYFEKLKEQENKLNMLLARNSSEYSNFSLKLYRCNFPAEILESALKDEHIKNEFVSQEDLDINEIKSAVDKYLAESGIHDWNVEISDKTEFYFRVRANKKTIYISQNMNWDFCDLDNALAHEIDGHVFRAINMQKQKETVYQKPLPFYVKTEEGLACFLGDYLSKTSELSRKHHALKYLAGKLAQTSSFLDVFEYLISKGFTKELAFQRTFRLKKGIIDSSKPGVNGHEAIYYEGMIEVKNYLENGGDIKALYACKAGLNQISDLPIQDNILIPKRLLKFRN